MITVQEFSQKGNPMFNQSHELADEFPEYKAVIHKLKQTDKHFTKLAEEYHEVTSEIQRIEEEIETPSDTYTEQKKKQRLALKDQLLTLIKKAA
jgi:uncharacterized protein YdcH (DUF465 family)